MATPGHHPSSCLWMMIVASAIGRWGGGEEGGRKGGREGVVCVALTADRRGFVTSLLERGK